MLVLIVFVGGALGALGRFAVASAIYRRASGFPWATLAVNVSGSALLGAAIPLLELTTSSMEMRTFLTVGVLGAFTTFSTFASDAVVLGHRERRYGAAAAYLAGTLVLGLAALGAGLRAGAYVARALGAG